MWLAAGQIRALRADHPYDLGQNVAGQGRRKIQALDAGHAADGQDRHQAPAGSLRAATAVKRSQTAALSLTSVCVLAALCLQAIAADPPAGFQGDWHGTSTCLVKPSA